MEYGIIRGLCWYRIVTALWACGIVAVSYDRIQRNEFAVMTVSFLVIYSFVLLNISRKDISILLRPGLVLSELGVSISITVLGGYLYQNDTAANTLAFASHFVLVSVLMCGVVFSIYGGIIAGVSVGGARLVAGYVNEIDISNVDFLLSIFSTTFTYTIAGALVGGVVSTIRKAGGELSEAKARDNIARTLHDGVLQTLVIIQKKSKENEIVDLAAKQEKDLREFLFKHQSNVSKSVISIHDIFKDIIKKYGEDLTVSVVIAPDTPELNKKQIKALTGAVNECVANTYKHAEANSVSIYVEPDQDVVNISIVDDGKGFNVGDLDDNTQDSVIKQGIRSSVIGRIEEVEGKVRINSSKSGTSIEILIPVQAKASF